MNIAEVIKEMEYGNKSDTKESDNGKPAHLLFVNQHYTPDVAPTGKYLANLAEYLVAHGYHVTVICSHGRYLGGQLDVPYQETINGVNIVRVPATSMGRSSHLRRLIDYSSFMLLTLWKALSKVKKPDMICCLTTPPMLGLIGYLINRIKGIKYIMWSMDLHPEAENALNMLPSFKPLISLLLKLGRFIYQKADGVVSLGPEMTRLIKNYPVPSEKIFQIPTWENGQLIRPLNGEARKEDYAFLMRNRDKFVVNYSGNIGLVHDLESISQVIYRLKDQKDLLFLFNGDGPRLDELQDYIRRHHIKNVEFHPYVHRSRLVYTLNRADLHWYSLKEECTGIAVPSKMISYMASGIPQIFIGSPRADNAQTVHAARCGYTFKPEYIDSIAEHILHLKKDHSLRSKLGLNGRRYFEKHLEKDINCSHWLSLIDRLVESGVSPQKGEGIYMNGYSKIPGS